MTAAEETFADLWATGTYGTHPIAHIRQLLTERGVRPAIDLRTAPPGGIVAVGGLVTHRQQPGTARGVVFLSLEDESGMANVICPPQVWERYRKIGVDASALVVHGLDGLDEITITGPTRIAEARDGSLRMYEVDPTEFGIERATLAEISGGDAADNAAMVREVLSGKKSPRRDVVVLNAAAALVAAGWANHLAHAIPLAMQSIDSGAAAKKLAALASFTNDVTNAERG